METLKKKLLMHKKVFYFLQKFVRIFFNSKLSFKIAGTLNYKINKNQIFKWHSKLFLRKLFTWSNKSTTQQSPLFFPLKIVSKLVKPNILHHAKCPFDLAHIENRFSPEKSPSMSSPSFRLTIANSKGLSLIVGQRLDFSARRREEEGTWQHSTRQMVNQICLQPFNVSWPSRLVSLHFKFSCFVL